MIRVGRLLVTPVRGFALADRDELRLERHGAPGNRRFYLVDEDGRRYTLTRDGRLNLLCAEYDDRGDRLTVHFPSGDELSGEAEPGDAIETEFYGGRTVAGRLVRGPWSGAISEFVGRPVRLVQIPDGVAKTARLGVSIVSDGSLAELSEYAAGPVDERRFRMLIRADGCGPREEERWFGSMLRIGEALVRILEPVERCAVTTRNPDSGEADLDTLRILRDYRGGSFDLGVAGEVLEPGRVRVGDPIALESS